MRKILRRGVALRPGGDSGSGERIQGVARATRDEWQGRKRRKGNNRIGQQETKQFNQHFAKNSRKKKSVQHFVWNSIFQLKIDNPASVNILFVGSATDTHCCGLFRETRSYDQLCGRLRSVSFATRGLPRTSNGFFCCCGSKKPNRLELHRFLRWSSIVSWRWQDKSQTWWFWRCFYNNILHTLFSHAELCLNEKLIFHSNNCYLHSAFGETELSTNTDCKDSWAECQGYHYLAKSSGKEQMFNKLAASSAEKKRVQSSALCCSSLWFFGLRELSTSKRNSTCASISISKQHCSPSKRHLWGDWKPWP